MQVAAVARDPAPELLQARKRFDDLVDLGAGEGVAVARSFKQDVLRAQFEQDAVHHRVVFDVLLALAALDFVERRLCDVDVALLDQRPHEAVEEREVERGDVRAVHVRVGHQDDLVVAHLFGVEMPVALRADARAQGGDQQPDILVVEHLVQAGLLHVQGLAKEREDGLVTAVASLLGRAAGGVSFNDVNLAQGGILFGAVGQVAGQTAAAQRALAHGFAGLAGGLAGARGVEALVDDALGQALGRLKGHLEVVADDFLHDAVNFTVRELGLGLTLEARLGHLDRDDRRQALAHVVAGDARVLVLDQVVGLAVVVDRACQRRAEARKVGAALDVEDRIGVGVNLVVVAVVVLHRHIDQNPRVAAVLAFGLA